MEIIKKKNIDQLIELKESLRLIADSEYSKELELLSNATVGKHVRHIIEFYLILMNSIDSGLINYEKRERKELLENSILSAENSILKIIDWIESLFGRTSIKVYQEGNISGLNSSVERELQYIYDHTTHHMAIVKIGFKILKPNVVISKDFGVADSTILYRNSQ